jgi:DNA-directed RNA polymerase sigma subunit (sigma70/sigma32)
MTLLAKSPEDDMLVAERYEKLHEFLSVLTSREYAVVAARLGFDGKPKTFSQISADWGLTPVGTSKVYHRAIRKLRRCNSRLKGGL